MTWISTKTLPVALAVGLLATGQTVASASAMAGAPGCTVGVSANDFVAQGSRHVDARTNYAATTGDLIWGDTWFAFTGQLVATSRPQTSYAYVHYETKGRQGCTIWYSHEYQIGSVYENQKVNVSADANNYPDSWVRNAWIETCTNRNGWTCSGWK